MDKVINLGGAAPDQFKEKRIGGVTGGIRADSGLMKLIQGGRSLMNREKLWRNRG